MQRRLLFLILTLLVCGQGFSNPVDRNSARKVAEQVLKGKTLKDTPRRVKTQFEAQESFPAYYIFNTDGSEGFVIVSADDAFPQVLAYSATGSFDVDKLNPGMQVRLDGFEDYVQDVRSGARKAPNNALLMADAEVIVSPLIKTQWEQGYPFNIYCPMDGSKHSVVGCVATAFAQIMKYWEWPLQGQNKLAYTCSLPGVGKIEIDFSKCEYNWALMPETKAQIVNNEAATDAVAKLCYECGVATRMDYSAAGSGTQDCYSMQALYTYMRYKASTMQWHFRDSYETQEEWDAIWKTELDEGRPLLYSGFSVEDGGGHAFIMDGYDSNGFTHINWGWGGSADGFYSPVLMNSGNGTYAVDQKMITGIEPDYEGTDVTPRQWRAYMEMAPSIAIKSGQKLGTTTLFSLPTFYNLCAFYCTWEVGLCLFDKSGNFIANVKKEDLINGDNVTLAPYRGVSMSAMFSLPQDLEDGDYVLRICFKQEGYDEWELPYMIGGDNLNRIPVKVEDGKAYYNEVSVSIDRVYAEDKQTDIRYSASYFDLQGRQVPTPAHGLYIHNGRKVMVK